MINEYTPKDNLTKARVLHAMGNSYFNSKQCKKSKEAIDNALKELVKLGYEYYNIQLYLDNKIKIEKLIKKHNKAKPKDKKKGRFCIDMDKNSKVVKI